MRETRDSKLPDGNPFAFWTDSTRYTRSYHVSQTPPASDENNGTATRPFRMIGRAAAAAKSLRPP